MPPETERVVGNLNGYSSRCPLLRHEKSLYGMQEHGAVGSGSKIGSLAACNSIRKRRTRAPCYVLLEVMT